MLNGKYHPKGKGTCTAEQRLKKEEEEKRERERTDSLLMAVTRQVGTSASSSSSALAATSATTDFSWILQQVPVMAVNVPHLSEATLKYHLQV